MNIESPRNANDAPDKAESTSPEHSWTLESVLLRFVSTAIFGAFVAALIAFSDFEFFLSAKGLCILAAIVLGWGLLGIFWWQRMLGLAKCIVEECLLTSRY